ncbi:unannotated protein [freshwater metagenome]|uniref:Unannotated protein n=1 Tax=freshwater metagenome TaxID=449393 RepID=A0A6J7IC14_9ZZZZ|nr:hypothetical protein [Actinomycetota bacterium]
MTARRAALVRLGVLTTALVVLLVVFNLGGVLDAERIRRWIDDFEVAAPILFVLLGGVLGAALVPGAVLAATAGLLFGAVAGALVSLPSAVLTAVLARSFSARTGGDALDELSGERLTAITSFARRHGFSAVVVQRLLPAVPDGPFSHAFGLAGVRTRDIALATLVASGPRAFSYALLGANADDLTGPHALFAIGLNVATGLFGLTLAWFVVRGERRRLARERAEGVPSRSSPLRDGGRPGPAGEAEDGDRDTA